MRSILFLLLPYRSVLDATHHWYSMLFEMAALAVLISSRTNMRSAVAGTLCGVAAFFTQSQGLLTVLGVGLFLLWEQHHKRESATWLLRREGALLATFSIAVAALNAYFVSKAGLGRFLYCTVVFPFKYYPSQPHNSWRAPLMELPHFNSWLSLRDATADEPVQVLIYDQIGKDWWSGGGVEVDSAGVGCGETCATSALPDCDPAGSP